MKINSEAFVVAMSIIAKSNQPKISINVPINNNFSNVHAIVIHESNADLIIKLVKEGFSLAMSPKGLSVDYYGSKYEWTREEG